VSEIRWIRADNPSPMTMDGTRTYIVGRVHVAVIDPGPSLQPHIDAVVAAVGSRVNASVLVTHAHPDHDEAASVVTTALRGTLVAPTDGQTIETDAGDLLTLATPGHTPDHLSFLLEQEHIIFCGDLMMGGLDTALVATPEGNLHDYLASLERLRELAPRVVYPAHGEPITDVAATIAKYVAHRAERLAQVIQALQAGPRSALGLVDTIYGASLDEGLRAYAASAVEAYLEYLAGEGRARRLNDDWSLI
jgi:glyoxylase-like metal-dependent hydrolase (beta-lactamase superfamily II)